MHSQPADLKATFHRGILRENETPFAANGTNAPMTCMIILGLTLGPRFFLADSVTHVHGQLADLKATLQGMVPADNPAIVGGHGTD